jgi:hypothetical protein
MVSSLGLYAEEATTENPAADNATSQNAAEEAPAPKLSQVCPSALGFSFGSEITTLTVFNLHYQRWFGNYGFAASGGAYLNNTVTGDFAADALLSFQYKFSEVNLVSSGDLYGCLYGYLQSGYVVQQTSTTSGYDPITYATIYNPPTFKQYVPVQVGIGMEVVLFKHISLPLEVGFEYQINGSNFGPVATTALRYRF